MRAVKCLVLGLVHAVLPTFPSCAAPDDQGLVARQEGLSCGREKDVDPGIPMASSGWIKSKAHIKLAKENPNYIMAQSLHSFFWVSLPAVLRARPLVLSAVVCLGARVRDQDLGGARKLVVALKLLAIIVDRKGHLKDVIQEFSACSCPLWLPVCISLHSAGPPFLGGLEFTHGVKTVRSGDWVNQTNRFRFQITH